MRTKVSLGIALAMIVGATPAQATWLRATTRHFVIYSEAKEADLQRQAIDLERLDAGIRKFQSLPDPDDVLSNKVTIFTVAAEDEIGALCKCGSVTGFYRAGVAGPLIFTPRRLTYRAGAVDPRIVLYHEYTHHLLLGGYERALPAWYSEGYAEFMSTARIDADSVQVGTAAEHRGWGLIRYKGRPIDQLLDTVKRRSLSDTQADWVYGRGWLLTHLILFDRERRVQFGKYLTSINSGTSSIVAAREAFGDLALLDRQLDSYKTRSTLPAIRIAHPDIATPQVAIAPVNLEAAALLPLRMRSVLGVDETSAPALYTRASKLATEHPDDAVAQGWLAEMAYDAKQEGAATAAAERALASDPRSVQALLYLARVRLRTAAANKASDPAVWTAARHLIVRANRVDSNDPEPLWQYYESYAVEGRPPTKSAIAGLYRAQELVPQDADVRLAASRHRIIDGEIAEAKRLLRPLAFDPHRSSENAAGRILAALENGQTGETAIAAGQEKAKVTK